MPNALMDLFAAIGPGRMGPMGHPPAPEWLLDRTRTTPGAPEWLTGHQEGFDAFNVTPRIEEVPMAPEWMKQPRTGDPTYGELVNMGIAPEQGSFQAVDIIPEMSQDAPYNLGAGFGSTVLKEILESGQGSFHPDQLVAQLGKMSQDEREMLGFEGYAPTAPMTGQQLGQEAMARKMQLGEVVKGENVVPYENIQRMNELRNVSSQRDLTLDEQMETRKLQQGIDSPTKFQQYQLPGGRDYQETLLTLEDRNLLERRKLLDEGLDYDSVNKIAPREEGSFQSSHFDEPNLLGHIRTNTRDVGGKPLHFLEEVQSDWHQQGREKGYKGKGGEGDDWKMEKTDSGLFVARLRNGHLALDNYGKPHMYRTEQAVRDAMTRTKVAETWEVPSAPFKKTWHELLMKKAMQQAGSKGMDLGWTTGEQQAERYDLSKQVEEIGYQKKDDGTYDLVIFPKGQADIGKRATAEELPGVVGKELANKILKGEGKLSKGGTFKTFSGLDLKVGGEGMKAFYDKMLPQAVNKMVKKHGGRVGQGEINVKKSYATRKEENYDPKKQIHTVGVPEMFKRRK